jgi:REP element-mobilizing transposase RayT
MSWIRVYIHLVFSTKNRHPFLDSKELRETVFQHIKQNAESKGIWLDCVNGYHDHVHCLVSLNREQSISKVAQLIKGESSFWINQNQLTKNKFNWQDDYWAVGVCERKIHSIRKYIQNQEDHHAKKTFIVELNEFMEQNGWEFIQKNG